MPAKSKAYWQERASIGKGATWYLDRWKDWYSKTLIKHSFKRVRKYLEGKNVLDAGCGDCWLSVWLSKKFDCEVLAVDYFDYVPDLDGKVAYVSGVDIERLHRCPWIEGHMPDVVVVCSVLECVNDWKKALRSIMSVAPVTILFEDLRMNSPSYQVGLDYKTAITWPMFVEEVSAIGAERKTIPMLNKVITANVVDRALFVRTPSWLWWLVALVTLVIDIVAQHFPWRGWVFDRGRFRLVVIEQDTYRTVGRGVESVSGVALKPAAPEDRVLKEGEQPKRRRENEPFGFDPGV